MSFLVELAITSVTFHEPWPRRLANSFIHCLSVFACKSEQTIVPHTECTVLLVFSITASYTSLNIQNEQLPIIQYNLMLKLFHSRESHPTPIHANKQPPRSIVIHCTRVYKCLHARSLFPSYPIMTFPEVCHSMQYGYLVPQHGHSSSRSLLFSPWAWFFHPSSWPRVSSPSSLQLAS